MPKPTSNTERYVDYIERTRTQYEHLGFPPYQWVHNTEAPAFAPLSKPVAQCKVGLIASGGIYRSGQVAFHFKDDVSYRMIARDTPKNELRATHFAYDLTDARDDIGCVFPLETLNDLVQHGLIDSVADPAYTFMGGIYSERKVRELLAPALAARLVKDEVDVAVLVPV